MGFFFSDEKKGGFKAENTLEQRKKESSKIMGKYADRIPIVVEVAKDSAGVLSLKNNKYKFLAPDELTLGQFNFVIRRNSTLKQEQGLIIFINNVIPPTSRTLKSLYDENKDEDGFLYCTISVENTFG